jgi:hypothetical protein
VAATLLCSDRTRHRSPELARHQLVEVFTQLMRAVDALQIPESRRTRMASSGKKKTTMAKLNRERKLRERRLDKQAKKDARKQAPTRQQGQSGDALTGDDATTISRSLGNTTALTRLDPSIRRSSTSDSDSRTPDTDHVRLPRLRAQTGLV